VEGLWRSRTLESKARRKGVLLDPAAFVEREKLTLTPLPCWQALKPAEHRARIRQLIEEIEVAAKLREEETGKPPLGRDAVCQQHPHFEPKRMKRGPAPLVHAVAPAVRRALRRAYFSFMDAYRYAARRLREGVTDIEFPEGAFLPPRFLRIAARSG
ncbi:MAG: hypothetical protein ABI689_05880, partial [Thermoanaerobaculia bacterium]